MLRAMEKDQKLRLLRGVPLFANCSKASLGQIARLADEVELPAGRVLTQQGRIGNEFFVIVEGKVRVERDGRRIQTEGPGDFLGEIALIDHRPRTATATCETPCRLLVLAHREFHALLAVSPAISNAVLKALAQRLRGLEPKAAH
jgi:CRP/FNR family transcriptional regulator, cyclic AMP receptor protein